MTLRWQIITGFGVLLVPLALIAITAFAVIGWLGGAVDAVLAENDRSLRAVAAMDVSLERLDSAALLGRTDEASEIAGVHRARFRSALADAASNLTIEGEAEVVTEVDAAFETVANADHDAARAAYGEALGPAFDRVRGELETLREMNQEAALLAAREAGSLARPLGALERRHRLPRGGRLGRVGRRQALGSDRRALRRAVMSIPFSYSYSVNPFGDRIDGVPVRLVDRPVDRLEVARADR